RRTQHYFWPFALPPAAHTCLRCVCRAIDGAGVFVTVGKAADARRRDGDGGGARHDLDSATHRRRSGADCRAHPSQRVIGPMGSVLRPSGPSEGIASPFASRERLQAILFDLDGTLYRQRPMQALMAAELLTLALRNPVAAPRRWRVLKEYRKAQE